MKKFTAIVVALLLASLVFVGCAPRESTEGVHGESSFSDGFEASDDSVGDSAEAPASEYAEESISEEAWVEESSEAEMSESESLDKEETGSGQSTDISGQFTAGEWNDNEEFDFFTDLLNQNEWYSKKEYWGYQDFSRIAVTVVSANTPVQNAQVQVLDSQNEILYWA